MIIYNSYKQLFANNLLGYIKFVLTYGYVMVKTI